MIFFGEPRTPNDINHVTVCSSGFMAPLVDHRPNAAMLREPRGLFRVGIQHIRTSASSLKKKKKKAVVGGKTRLPYAQSGEQQPSQHRGISGVIYVRTKHQHAHEDLCFTICMHMYNKEGTRWRHDKPM